MQLIMMQIDRILLSLLYQSPSYIYMNILEEFTLRVKILICNPCLRVTLIRADRNYYICCST